MPTDFYWTLDGDITYGRNGDIRDTSFDSARSIFQEIRTRVRSAFRDWAVHPSMGANLDESLGRPNNRLTAEEGKGKIIASLVWNGFLRKEAIRVRYVPISKHQIAYFIQVTIVLPETGESRMLQTQVLYDTEESSLRVV
jgi:hypothetical protein